MSITLRKQQMIALAILALLTLIVIGLTLFSFVAHVDVWRNILSFSGVKSAVMYWGP